MSEDELNLRVSAMSQELKGIANMLQDRCIQLSVALALSNKERDDALARVADLEKKPEDSGN